MLLLLFAIGSDIFQIANAFSHIPLGVVGYVCIRTYVAYIGIKSCIYFVCVWLYSVKLFQFCIKIFSIFPLIDDP